MHELPKELNNSLRSFRGSIYGNRNSTHQDVLDLEKGQEDYGDKAFERALSPTESSIILHPTKSRYALHQQFNQQDHASERDHYPQPLGELQRQGRGGQQQRQQQQQPPGLKSAVAKRQATLPPQTPASAHKSIFSQPKVDDPDPAADRLDDDPNPLSTEDFYELIGMNVPSAKGQNPKELATRHGLYGGIHHHLKYIQTKYRIYDVLIYIFLILQLFLSAVFIVLGSLTRVDSHIPIAVLGAFSTVVAGALALMKGQGLPNRLRQTRDALRNVIFEAEELYWDVGAARPVYYKDIKKVREDYLRVLEEARKNHPDTWNSTATGVAKGVDAGGKGKAASVAPQATPKP